MSLDNMCVMHLIIMQADEDPDRTKRIIIQKRIFPLSKKPNLLTSVEKETIR